MPLVQDGCAWDCLFPSETSLEVTALEKLHQALVEQMNMGVPSRLLLLAPLLKSMALLVH